MTKTRYWTRNFFRSVLMPLISFGRLAGNHHVIGFGKCVGVYSRRNVFPGFSRVLLFARLFQQTIFRLFQISLLRSLRARIAHQNFVIVSVKARTTGTRPCFPGTELLPCSHKFFDIVDRFHGCFTFKEPPCRKAECLRWRLLCNRSTRFFISNKRY